MKTKDFEREILAALRDPKFWGRWGSSLSLGLLSPYGQKIARALTFCHKAKPGGVVGLPELQIALRREGEVGETLRNLTREVTAKHAASLEVQVSLATEVLTRNTLEGLMRRAGEQLQTGKFDLAALATSAREVAPGEEHVRAFDPRWIIADDEGLAPVPTPWRSVNEQMVGLYPRELGMVLATPKAGKTGALLNLSSKALSNGWSVLYITAADVGYAGICRRITGIWKDVSIQELRHHPKDFRSALEECRGDWDDLGAQFVVADYTARTCSMLEIERVIAAVRGTNGDCKWVVMIDRLEQAIPPDKSGDLRRDMTSNFEYARMLAHRYVVPIWCDSQASLQNGDEGYVDITRGAESRVGKAKVVDIGIGIGVNPDDDNTLRLMLAGRREWTNRRFEVRRDPRSGVMYE